MNTQQLLGWMKDPGSLGKEAGAQLDALSQSFPYFQTAHLLLIKSLHNQNSFLYNNQLKVAAAYATNRRVLYELITKRGSGPGDNEGIQEKANEIATPKTEAETSKQQSQLPESEKIIQPEFPKKRFVSNPDEWEAGMVRQLQLLHHWKTTPVPETAEKKPEPEKQAEPEKISSGKPTAADEINTLLYVLVEPSSAEDINETEVEISAENGETEWEVKPVEEKTETEEIQQPPEIPQDPVHREIIREAISSSIELEVDDTLPSPEEMIAKPQFRETAEVVNYPEESLVEGTPVEEIPDSTLSGFASWLKMMNSGIPEEKKEPVPLPLEKTKLPDHQIIEKFIQEAPRISPQKNTFYSPVNMAKKSVQENDEFITETLARIYAKQGNISKAIRTYQKLSLKFPEKSSYFAALIEELKRTPK
jgi:hypothetical protein